MKNHQDGVRDGYYYSIEIRQDMTQRLLVNHYMSGDITLLSHHGTNESDSITNNKTVMWKVPQNHNSTSVDETTICLQFATESLANEFKLLFTNCQYHKMT